ncbi:MAG: hypothetical protein ACM3RX_01665 [Methanococcaceae archaeon]|jgi:hypothetical protein
MEQPKKKSVQTIIGLVVGLAVMVLVQQLMFKAPGFDKTMMKVASELNKTCPFMVDSETQLDNAIALPDNVFQYNYTLINTSKDSIDIQVFENIMKPMLIKNIGSTPELKTFRDNKVTMVYSYKDKNGNFLSKISVTYDDYTK